MSELRNQVRAILANSTGKLDDEAVRLIGRLAVECSDKIESGVEMLSPSDRVAHAIADREIRRLQSE